MFGVFWGWWCIDLSTSGSFDFSSCAPLLGRTFDRAINENNYYKKEERRKIYKSRGFKRWLRASIVAKEKRSLFLFYGGVIIICPQVLKILLLLLLVHHLFIFPCLVKKKKNKNNGMKTRSTATRLSRNRPWKLNPAIERQTQRRWQCQMCAGIPGNRLVSHPFVCFFVVDR